MAAGPGFLETPFVGRERELAELAEMMKPDYVRFVTLTGPGGIGKSRLAFEATRRMADRYRDGIAHVRLSPLADAAAVMPAIAEALGVRESAERTIFENLVGYLRDRRMLIVLDNFEHVLQAAPALTELLIACLELNIIVTSRVLLSARGEHEYAVPSLGLPGDQDTVDDVDRFDAVRLFVERAREVRPEFRPSEDDLSVIAKVCARLDGLPLAIELTAARIATMDPDEILVRLTDRLELLGPSVDDSHSHRTLRAALDWDYESLPPDEARAFRALSVFAGGWTLLAADAILGSARSGITEDLVSSLATRSLVLRSGDPRRHRYAMLKTVREYASELLEGAGEAPLFGDRHASFFTHLAEEAAPGIRGADQVMWLQTVEAEHDNIRAALRWAAASGDNETELRLAGAMATYWEFRAHLSEGQGYLEDALARAGESHPELRARCLEGAGVLARGQGEYKRAATLIGRALELYREKGDVRASAGALKNLGIVASERGDVASAQRLYEESLELRRQIGDRRGIAEAQNNLGVIARLAGDLDRAVAYYEDALGYFNEQSDKLAVARILMNIGEAKMESGEFAAAKGYVRGSLILCREIGSHWDIADLLEINAAVTNGFGRPVEAARFLGAAAALRDLIGAPVPESERGYYERRLAAVREGLSEADFRRAWDEGYAMDVDAAVDAALA